MKHVLLGVVCCLVLCAATAQNNSQTNYVDVTVSDTVQIRADYFVLRITATGDYDYTPQTDTAGMRTDPTGYYRRMEAKRLEKQKDFSKTLEVKLKNAGFTLEGPLLSDFAYRNSATSIFSVSTHSAETLAALSEMLKTEKGMLVSITQVSSSQEEASTMRLQQKLIAKAKARAAELARLSGKKLSTIISVVKSEQQTYFQSNVGLITSLGVDRLASQGEKINTLYPMPGTISVKFAWL